MNFTQLRAFHAVASEGGFTRGAMRLGVSQPAVTAHIKALEQAYGIELFHRRGQRVELTDFGRSVLGHSRRVVARTSGFLVPPGRPFNVAGASLADDFVVYALDREPEAVRLLGLEPRERLGPGARVEILGIPTSTAKDEESLAGKVIEASDERIDVELVSSYDLRGWGRSRQAPDAADTGQISTDLEALARVSQELSHLLFLRDLRSAAERGT